MVRTDRIAVLVLLAALSGCADAPLKFSDSLRTWRHGDVEGDGFICVPKGEPPFPAVVFNHGIYADERGFIAAARKGLDLEGLCESFARDGFLALLPVRRSGSAHLREHLREVTAALAAVRARPDVDPDRVTLGGHSRGGLLTFMAAIRGAQARSFMLFAPATGPTKLFTKLLGAVPRIDAPVLLMVEHNDKFAEVREAVSRLEEAFRAAGTPHKFIRYERGGGHNLFLAPGYYWPDMLDFLRNPPESDGRGFRRPRWPGGGFGPGRPGRGEGPPWRRRGNRWR